MKISHTILIISTVLSSILSGQQILLDKPVKAGELILFPTVSDVNSYYYLPDKPRLGVNNGLAQFSFLRYVKNATSERTTNETVSESGFGGGVLHALIELTVSDEMIAAADKSLKKINARAKIVGPIIFKSGTVALITSIAQSSNENNQKVIGLGHAPILENQKSAVSIQLNNLNSKILWESFNTPTPDFSFNFEMEIEGYLSPKRILIEADFQRIYSNKTVQSAVVSPVLAAEINLALDELFDSGAIKITQIGNDEDLEKLKQTAYEQIINLIFEKVGGTGVPQLNQLLPNNQKSMLDRATEMLSNARKDARDENKRIEDSEREKEERVEQMKSRALTGVNKSRKEKGLPEIEGFETNSNNNDLSNSNNTPQKEPIPGLAVAVSYQQKQVKQVGTYRIDLNKYTEATRSIPFAYNPGNVKNLCPSCFKEVNLDDPLMKQREINTSIAGIGNDDFSSYINFVNIVIKKKHQSGEETIQEVKIDKKEFNNQGNLYRMVYGWKGDDNRNKWLEYDYKTLWSFKGNHQVESPWIKNNFSSINLEPPFNRKNIYIEVDQDFVSENEVRGLEIKIITKLNNNDSDVKLINLKTNQNELTSNVQVLLPMKAEQYEYEITYFMKGKDPVKSRMVSTTNGRIDIDRLPY